MALNLSNHIWVSSDSDANEDEVVKCENQDFMKRSEDYSYLLEFLNQKCQTNSNMLEYLSKNLERAHNVYEIGLESQMQQVDGVVPVSCVKLNLETSCSRKEFLGLTSSQQSVLEDLENPGENSKKDGNKFSHQTNKTNLEEESKEMTNCKNDVIQEPKSLIQAKQRLSYKFLH